MQMPRSLRLPTVFAAAISIGLATAVCPDSRLAAADEWTRYGGPSGNFVLPALSESSLPKIAWEHPIGWGSSAIVANSTHLVTMESVPGPAKEEATESVLALDPRTGKELWKQSYPVRFRGEQQIHEEPIQPLSTPLLLGDAVYTLSFDGVVRKLSLDNGAVLWQLDLVEKYEATPVQYGFAASLVAIDEDKLLVAAGGAQTALLAISTQDASLLWKSAPDEPAYATPVLCELAGKRQAVLLGRDAIAGYDILDGKTLWRQELKSVGLTNVPTPLILEGNRVVISGQGCSGTTCLKIENDAEKQKCSELWRTSRAQFFYCNWIHLNGYIYGFDTRFFVCLDTQDGRVVWKSREQTDANCVLLQDQLLLLRGDGLLSLVEPTAEKLNSLKRISTFQEGHCWAPPTVVGSTVYLRNNQAIKAIDLSSLSADSPIPSEPESSKMDAALKRWSGK